MVNNKIALSDGTVLLDLTADTATAADVVSGKRFHLASGVQTVGTLGDDPPEDGKTRVYINIPYGTPADERVFPLMFQPTVEGGVVIDWGDGSSEVTTGTERKSFPHAYAEPGEYCITISCTSGSIVIGGTTAAAIYGTSGNDVMYNRSRVTKVFCGSNVSALTSSAFQYCYTLHRLVLPAIATYGVNIIRYTYALGHVELPSGLTAIPQNFAQNAYCLGHVDIPASVTSIAAGAFGSCRSLMEVHCRPTTPPTLANVSAFNDLHPDVKIYVPSASVSAYKAASNWSTYASIIEGE